MCNKEKTHNLNDYSINYKSLYYFFLKQFIMTLDNKHKPEWKSIDSNIRNDILSSWLELDENTERIAEKYSLSINQVNSVLEKFSADHIKNYHDIREDIGEGQFEEDKEWINLTDEQKLSLLENFRKNIKTLKAKKEYSINEFLERFD